MEDLKKARPGDGCLSAFAGRGPAGVFDGLDIGFPFSEYMEKKMGCQGRSGCLLSSGSGVRVTPGALSYSS